MEVGLRREEPHTTPRDGGEGGAVTGWGKAGAEQKGAAGDLWISEEVGEEIL